MRIKIIVKTKITETDSGVGIYTKEGVLYVHIINLSSHGINVYVRYKIMSIFSRHNLGKI